MQKTARLLVDIQGAAAGEGVSSNPLKQVLDAVGETVDCAVYDRVSHNVYTVVPTILRVAQASVTGST